MKRERLDELSGGGAAAPDVQAPGENLDDPALQAKILNPEPQAITIGGKEVIIYPLSARIARRFSGFVSMLMTEAVAGKTDIGPNVMMTSRLLGLLNLRFEDDFLPILAAASGRPGVIDDVRARSLGERYSEIISAAEVQRAFLTLYAQNTPVSGQKKADPAPAHPRRRRRTH